MTTKLVAALVAAFAVIGTVPATAGVIFLGPTPYLSAADSPFDLSRNFYVEDFEDGALNTPGVTGRVKIHAPGPTTDSVDADDGVIDGSGLGGYSAIPRDGGCTNSEPPYCSSSSTFVFTEDAFGRLPNAFGYVWTDGSPYEETGLLIYDRSGLLIDEAIYTGIGDPPLGSVEGATAEDRFFGAIYGRGIGRVVIGAGGPFGYLEFDHLQYGLVVPEPATSALLLAGVAAIGLVAVRRS